ncbi:MAG: sigma 54-interacting transcriptional regulator [Deltaproteobacteria bacterium]|nr:sigma 54-interacting transcriptional regulator [Deltaproteobacteria bacterium]
MPNEFPALLRFTLDRLEDAIFIVDEAQNIVFCNAAAERLTGKDRKSVLGTHCSHVFGGATDEAYCVFQELRERDVDHTGRRTAVRHPDGTAVPVEMRLTRIPAEVAGRPLMMGTIRDLSVLERLEVEATQRYRFGDILSRSPAMARVFDLIRSVADTDVSVLVTGESGTGKELVARALHELSPRRDGPFHAVNCGALSPELLDSEIFGHEKGAFTGAVRQKPGRLESAKGGTLFLDEIGDMPPALQVKLLRVLQERTFERVGGVKTLKMDARIIAATHADLRQAVAQGRFLERPLLPDQRRARAASAAEGAARGRRDSRRTLPAPVSSPRGQAGQTIQRRGDEAAHQSPVAGQRARADQRRGIRAGRDAGRRDPPGRSAAVVSQLGVRRDANAARHRGSRAAGVAAVRNGRRFGEGTSSRSPRAPSFSTRRRRQGTRRFPNDPLAPHERTRNGLAFHLKHK